MKISLQSKITLRPLSIQQDQRHYIVEEPVSGEFFEMPKICIDAIELMNEGEGLEQIESTLQEKYPDEKVDIVEFVEQLIDLNLVETVDGEIIKEDKKKSAKGGMKWISPVIGRIFFNKVTNKIYGLLLLLNIILFIINPSLFPAYKDIFLFDSMVGNLLTYMLISLVLIMIHEFGHILAIRSYNLPTKLDIGNRLLFVVFETDLTTAWKLSPKQRNPLYLAGMAMEQSILFIALIIQLILPEGDSLFLGILGVVVFDILVKTLYQCCFYMKTDLYYVFENVTGCYNLMENGKQFLSKWLPFIKADPTTEAFEGEEKVIRLYSIFYLTGVCITFTLLGFYFLPQAFYAYKHVFSNFTLSFGSTAFWDGVVFIAQTLLMGGLLLYALVKKRADNSNE